MAAAGCGHGPHRTSASPGLAPTITQCAHQDGRVNCGNRRAEMFWADAGLWLLAFNSALRTLQSAMLFPVPESRFPAVGRRLPFWQFPRSSSPESRKPRATSRERRATGHEPARRRRFSPNPCSAFGVYPPWRAVSAVKERRVPRRCFFATSYPQRRMRIRACKKPSKTIKFVSKSIKKATFSVKKGSKKRAFRHAHLNILWGHPLWR